MAATTVQIYTQEITNTTLTIPFDNTLNIVELSINLKSGVGRFAGFYALIPLGPSFSTPNYIDLVVGQPITIASNFNFPVGGCVIDCAAGLGGVIQIIATHVGDVYP